MPALVIAITQPVTVAGVTIPGSTTKTDVGSASFEKVTVQPGAIVHGPGKCTPGAIDCEVLSLGANQVESVSVQTPASSRSARAISTAK